MYSFKYRRAQSVSEAVELLRELDAPKLLAGGQTLIPTMKQRLAQPSDLIDLGGLEELKGIREEGGGLTIGAMTRHAEVAASELVQRVIPALADLADGIGDRQVRNRGTLGGSICNNDPAADYPSAVLALGAEVRTDRRTIAGDAFFVGMFETALEPDEVVVAVHFPKPLRAAYAKFPNPASRYATVGVFVARFDDAVRVAVTGAAPCVFRAEALEQALTRDFTPSAIDDVEVDPSPLNSDMHATAEYRANLIKVMARRAVQACL